VSSIPVFVVPLTAIRSLSVSCISNPLVVEVSFLLSVYLYICM